VTPDRAALRRLAVGAAAALSLAGSGCKCGEDPVEAGSDARALPTSSAERGELDSVAYDLVANLDTCEVRHRGLLLDLGTRSARSRRGYRIGPFDDAVDLQRGGASFSRVLSRRTAYEFFLDQPLEGIFVSARVRGAASRRMSVSIDERRLGSVKLVSGETRIVSVPPLQAELAAGRHVLTLGFDGKKTPPEIGYAELDWIRIGVGDDSAVTYAAPTREDIVTDVALDAKPRRSVVLRAPSTLRCPVRLSPDATLRVALGFWGSGRGSAEVRVVTDGAPPVELSQRRITGGSGATWVPLEIPLREHAGRVAALELSALESSRGGRVVFGDPIIARASATVPRVPEARAVVIVIAAGLERRHVPPWGPTGGLAAVGELARQGAAFSGYRVPSTVTSAVVASLLTGLAPRAHGLEDPAARLPASVRTLSEMFKEAGGRTAMFTAVPTTFASFGFDVGWDRYQTYSPVKDVAADEALMAAGSWLERVLDEVGGPKSLLVVHARGAHPPWDVPRDDVAKLPPAEYVGAIDARRGAITLANVRARRLRAQRRLEDHDWIRLRALQAAALTRQNEGISRLIGILQRKGAWNDALFVLVGDVAPGDPPEVPFEPAGPLGEDRLLVPLLVKFPEGRFAASEIAGAVTPLELSRSVLDALRVAVPDYFVDADLFQLAAGVEPLTGRPAIAVGGEQYSTRLGSLLLHGQFGRVPKLCQLDIDPNCLADALSKLPIASSALWQWTYASETAVRELRPAQREPASIDPDTAAALTVWGDL
jgi:arylsulfatase A-like enzyme